MPMVEMAMKKKIEESIHHTKERNLAGHGLPKPYDPLHSSHVFLHETLEYVTLDKAWATSNDILVINF